MSGKSCCYVPIPITTFSPNLTAAVWGAVRPFMSDKSPLSGLSGFLNPLLSSGLFHSYQVDEPICQLRGIRFSLFVLFILFHFEEKYIFA